MKIEVDRYTKFILTVIAIGLLLNAVMPLVAHSMNPVPVRASNEPMEVKIVDVRSTWPAEVKVTNWPDFSRR